MTPYLPNRREIPRLIMIAKMVFQPMRATVSTAGPPCIGLMLRASSAWRSSTGRLNASIMRLPRKACRSRTSPL